MNRIAQVAHRHHYRREVFHEEYSAGTTLVGLSVSATRAAETNLYQHLGGKTAITAVVGDFVARVAADTRINAFFAATAADPKRLAGFKAKLVDRRGSSRST